MSSFASAFRSAVQNELSEFKTFAEAWRAIERSGAAKKAFAALNSIEPPRNGRVWLSPFLAGQLDMGNIFAVKRISLSELATLRVLPQPARVHWQESHQDVTFSACSMDVAALYTTVLQVPDPFSSRILPVEMHHLFSTEMLNDMLAALKQVSVSQ